MAWQMMKKISTKSVEKLAEPLQSAGFCVGLAFIEARYYKNKMSLLQLAKMRRIEKADLCGEVWLIWIAVIQYDGEENERKSMESIAIKFHAMPTWSMAITMKLRNRFTAKAISHLLFRDKYPKN